MLKNLALVAIALFCAASVLASPKQKQLYCHPGWGGGDNGYDQFEQVVISDKPIRSVRVRSEADPGYQTQKGSQSAILSLSTGWDNTETYGANVVLYYGPKSGTKASFAIANYAFAKKCLVKQLSPDLRKQLKKAVLNPNRRK